MSAADQQLHREILTLIYEEHDDRFRGTMVDTRSLAEEFEELDTAELRYHIDRLKDDYLLEQTAQHHVRITSDGVEKLAQKGYKTFLESDLRYEILRVAYEIDRGKSVVYIDQNDIVEELDITAEELQPHLWYLSQKDLIDLTGTNSMIELTGTGRNRYEEYRDEGMPIPRTDPIQKFTQHTIAQGDKDKAENVFRDIVEVARDEVIVIDAYAKGRLYDMMEAHIPSVVDVKILMSDREVGDENIEAYHDFTQGRRGVVDLRYLDYWDEYPFHTREVIRDREAGWIWDHTFADAGNRHHTISQLRPVNLENDLDVFDEVWQEAETVE
jgi:predicted transcriptional regulator